MGNVQHVRRAKNGHVQRDKARLGEKFRDDYFKSKLNKTFSFTGFPWHLDEKEEWLNIKSTTRPSRRRASMELGVVLGNRRARSEMKHAEVDLRTKKYPYHSVTSRDHHLEEADPSREEKVISWLDKTVFSSKCAKFDIRNAWSDKI